MAACGLGRARENVCRRVPRTRPSYLHRHRPALYQTEAYPASHSPAALAALQHQHSSSQGQGSSTHGHRSPARASSHGHDSASSQLHGSHGKAHGKPEMCAWGAVFLLLGIRLGLDGVNPVYHATIKGDGLFYLDPRHSRPTAPLRPHLPSASISTSHSAPAPHDSARDGAHAHDTRRSLSPEAYARGESMSPEYGYARACPGSRTDTGTRR
ncbi:hypothetical protein DFH09DRAFT_508424 [Mycena vulgaris]|nr:hypothetical protein DFH09DRAFT_508424 [Mycena vulgaris]